jgi:type II secretion system protein L
MTAPVSVVIPTLDAAARLGPCLGALTEGLMRGLIAELVLADGGSTDGIEAVADAAGARLVAAIAEPRLQAWLDQCRSVGADPHIVVLDCTAWPVDGEVAIVVTPNRVIVAGGQLGGFSTDPAIAPALTARWLNDAGADGARIVLWGGDAESYRRTLQRDFEVRDAADVVACLAAGAATIAAFAPNLRQGAFVAEGRKQQPFKFWRLTALLAVAAVMLQVGSLVISGVRDRQTASQIEAAAERDFRAARPDVGRVVNLRAQVAALVNAQTQAARHPVLVTSNPVADALRQQPLARLDEVRHQAPAREVRLTITAQDQPSIDAIAALLREADLTVETRIVRPRDGRVAAELVVGAP